MSASVHSQASSRPQSTVSGIPAAAANQDQASAEMSHHSEAVEQQQYVETFGAAELAPTLLGAAPLSVVESMLVDVPAQQITTTEQTTYTQKETGALIGATVTSRAVEVNTVEPNAATTTTTTTYSTGPVATNYVHASGTTGGFSTAGAITGGFSTGAAISGGYSATTTTTTGALNTYGATGQLNTYSAGGQVTGHIGGAGTTTTTTTSNVRNNDIDPSMFGENCYTHTRKVSNVIVSETLLGQVPQQDEIRYVEADPSRFPPEERVTHVIKKETREKVVEKKVPVIEYVDRVVEVPRIEYVDRVVEVPQVHEVYVDQRVAQTVDRVVEVVKEVPVVRERQVEQVVEVPGGIIEVPKPYAVHVEKEVFRAIETEKPVIVAQVVKPVIKESSKQLVVDVMDFEPEVIPVDVHVAKPVGSALELVGSSEVRHRLVNITSAQYNTILRQLNNHVDGKFQVGLPYVRENGQTLFLQNEQINYIEAPVDVRIEGYVAKHTTVAPIEVMSRGPASAFTSGVVYRGGCPTNITQAMQVCTTQTTAGRAQQQIEVPTIHTEVRGVQPSSIHQGASIHATSLQQHQPIVTAQYGTIGGTVEVPRSAVEAAQSIINSATQYQAEEVKVTSRDLAMAPVPTGSEVRTFPGAASLPREGGSIRSQLPAQQPSRICC